MIALDRGRRLHCSLEDALRALTAAVERNAVGPVSMCTLPALSFHWADHGDSYSRTVRFIRRHDAVRTGPQLVVAWQIQSAGACSRFAGMLSLDADDGAAVLTLTGTCEAAATPDADLEEDEFVCSLSERTADEFLEFVASDAYAANRNAA